MTWQQCQETCFLCGIKIDLIDNQLKIWSPMLPSKTQFFLITCLSFFPVLFFYFISLPKIYEKLMSVLNVCWVNLKNRCATDRLKVDGHVDNVSFFFWHVNSRLNMHGCIGDTIINITSIYPMWYFFFSQTTLALEML